MKHSETGPPPRLLPVAHDHTHAVNNGKRSLTIDELALTQPGMDRLMAELGPRMHRLYYAGQAGNWPLAGYFYKSVVKQLRLCVESRPKYEAEMAVYLREDCEPVSAAIRAGNGATFETSYARMVARGNDYHGIFGKPYIAWVCPATPPDDLDLLAGMNPTN